VAGDGGSLQLDCRKCGMEEGIAQQIRWEWRGIKLIRVRFWEATPSTWRGHGGATWGYIQNQIQHKKLG